MIQNGLGTTHLRLWNSASVFCLSWKIFELMHHIAQTHGADGLKNVTGLTNITGFLHMPISRSQSFNRCPSSTYPHHSMYWPRVPKSSKRLQSQLSNLQSPEALSEARRQTCLPHSPPLCKAGSQYQCPEAALQVAVPSRLSPTRSRRSGQLAL